MPVRQHSDIGISTPQVSKVLIVIKTVVFGYDQVRNTTAATRDVAERNRKDCQFSLYTPALETGSAFCRMFSLCSWLSLDMLWLSLVLGHPQKHIV
jgi:hypothetical protein